MSGVRPMKNKERYALCEQAPTGTVFFIFPMAYRNAREKQELFEGFLGIGVVVYW